VSPSARRWVRLVMIALPLYFGWEMLQAPGFTGMPEGWVAGTAVCRLAAVVDAGLVAGFYGLGWILFANPRWFAPPRFQRYALLVLAGLAVSVGLEWLLVQRLHLFGYSPAQPVVPGIGVGLWAILQPLVLLPLIFGLLARWERRS